MPDDCEWCGEGPCPYPDGSCPPVIIVPAGVPDLFAADLEDIAEAAAIRLRGEAREQAIIRDGEDMLDARWGSPLTPADAYEFANLEIRTTADGTLGAQYVEEVGPGTPMQETIDETLNPLEQEVEDERHRDDDGRPRPDG